MKKYNVGVVGVGVGKSHIEAYQAHPARFTVQAVMSVPVDAAAAVAEEYNITHVATDFDAMCARDDIDIIDLCTPNSLHTPQALQALAAGKHVVVEKPVAGSLADIDRLIEAEAASNKRLMPIFQYRYGNGIQKLKALRDAELTGPAYLTTIETLWRRRPEYYAVPWRGKWETEMGGALITLAIHAHDALCFILGPVKSVTARAKTLVNDIETEDTVAAALEMADGSLATLAVTTGSSRQVSRQRYHFQNLVAESNTEAYTNTEDPWLFDGDTPELQAQIDAVLATFSPVPPRWTGQFADFHRALTAGSELPVTLNDARMSAELLTALYHSARAGQSVELPITPEHPLYGGWMPR